MDPVTIYVFGDVQMAAKVVEGMNLVFNSKLWHDPTNPSVYQAGDLFTFGILLVLWGSVLAWFIHQRFNLGPLLLSFIIFIAMTIPRTPLIISDFFEKEADIVVSDTPLGIAVVASLGSFIAKAMADEYDTVFTPVGADQSTVRQKGFVAPLRLLLALRKLVPHTGDPYVWGNLANYMRICAQDTAPGGFNIDTAVGKVKFFLDHPGMGIVTYKSVAFPDGTGLSCPDVANNLKTLLDNYMASMSTNATEDLNAALESPVGSDYISPTWKWDDAVAAMSGFFSGDANKARTFMMDLLFQNWASAGKACGAASNNYEFRECLSNMIQSIEEAKVETTMGASLFQKVMIPLMNLLTYLFYGMAPIIIVIAVAMGIQGIGILLKYALFGFWVQSWMPVAIFINYIIWEQTKSELNNFFSAFGAGHYNPAHFYDIVSTKLMVASDLLAATPMITFAIIGGGVYAMTNIAGAAGRAAASKANPSNTAPKLRETKPLHSFAGFQHSNPRNMRLKASQFSAGMASGVADIDPWLKGAGGMANVQSTANKALSHAKSRVTSAASRVSGQVSRIGSLTRTAVDTFGNTIRGSSGRSVDGSLNRQVASRITNRLGISDQTTEEQGESFQALASLGASMAAKARASFNDGKISQSEYIKKLADTVRFIEDGFGALGASMGLSLDAKGQAAGDLARKIVEGASSSDDLALDRVVNGTYSDREMGQLLREAIESRQNEFREAAQDTEQYLAQYEQAVSEAEQLDKTVSRINSSGFSRGGNVLETLISRWQAGGSVPIGWNQDRFNAFVDAQVSARRLSAEEGQRTKVLFADHLDQAHKTLHRHGYDGQFNTEQKGAVAAWLAYQGIHMPSASAESAFLKEKTRMASDYLGLVGDAPDTGKDAPQRLGQSMPAPNQSGNAGQAVLDRQGRGGLYGAAENRSRRSMPMPESEFQRGRQEAGKQFAQGNKASIARHEDPNNPVRKQHNTRDGSTRTQVENSFLTGGAEKTQEAIKHGQRLWNKDTTEELWDASQSAGRASGERDPLSPASNAEVYRLQHKGAARSLGIKPSGDARRDIGRVFAQDLVYFNLPHTTKASYAATRQAAFLHEQETGRTYDLDQVIEQTRPNRSSFPSEQAYREALHGWELAKTVQAEQGTAPGLPVRSRKVEKKLMQIPASNATQPHAAVDYRSDLFGLALSNRTIDTYASTREQARRLALKGQGGRTNRELSERLGDLRPRREQYANDHEYRESLLGWRMAVSAVLEKGATPGLRSGEVLSGNPARRERGAESRPSTSTFFNPAALPKLH